MVSDAIVIVDHKPSTEGRKSLLDSSRFQNLGEVDEYSEGDSLAENSMASYEDEGVSELHRGDLDKGHPSPLFSVKSSHDTFCEAASPLSLSVDAGPHASVTLSVKASPVAAPLLRKGSSFTHKRKTMFSASATSDSKAVTAPEAYLDPHEGMQRLPLYLRGGTTAPGLGPLLGNALALLYVARYGLKERELWAILSNLSTDPGLGGKASSSGMRASTSTEEKSNRTLLSLCYSARGHLEDYWRSNDPMLTHFITISRIEAGISKVFPEFGRLEAFKLLEMTDLITAPRGIKLFGSKSSSFLRDVDAGDEMKVDYRELVRRIHQLERAERRSEVKTRLATNQSHGAPTGDKLDDFTLPAKELQAGVSAPTSSVESGGDIVNGVEGLSVYSESHNHLDERSLGPLVEEALLTILCALGVLHSPENQVSDVD